MHRYLGQGLNRPDKTAQRYGKALDRLVRYFWGWISSDQAHPDETLKPRGHGGFRESLIFPRTSLRCECWEPNAVPLRNVMGEPSDSERNSYFSLFLSVAEQAMLETCPIAKFPICLHLVPERQIIDLVDARAAPARDANSPAPAFLWLPMWIYKQLDFVA